MPEPRFQEVTRLVGWRRAAPGLVALELSLADARGGFSRVAAEVRIARDASLRLRAAAGPLPGDASEAIGFPPWRDADAPAVAREDGGVALSCDGPEGRVSLEVDAYPFAVRVREGDGTVVAALDGLAFADDGRARIRLAAPLGQRFHGFGEKTGKLDKRGDALLMRSRDMMPMPGIDPLYVSIPFFLALTPPAPEDPRLRATGFFLCSFARSRFDVARRNRLAIELETDAGGIDLTIFPGPHPRDVLRRFSARVGRAPLPPRWALGHHQSRWSYGSEREVRAVAAELRRRAIPTDAIHLDIDYMDGYRVFTWDRRRFPDPKGLLRDLREQGFRVVTIVDPGVKVDSGYAVYRDGRALDAFCRKADGSPFSLRVWPGDAALPDFLRPAVRAWWGEQHRALLDAGVAGIWNDMNEPAGWMRDLRFRRLILPWRLQDLSRVVQSDPLRPDDKAARLPHEHVRNLYGQQHSRATREFLEAAEPQRRHFVLSRSGFAGIQRFAAVWTGDVASRWSHLRLSIPMLLNLSLSGVPFCGADIGGFAGSCTPELYARWIQIGALQPFARTHSMWLARRQEPWSFGSRVEGIARDALGLRMRLLPYLEQLFREAESTGAPVWRPLFWEFPEDPESAKVEDQIMVGGALLAAPVLQRGARTRELWLPPGTWYAWHDGARFEGSRRLTVPAPLERIPLFVRGGSIVPMRDLAQHAAESSQASLALHVFPGADCDLELVEDDGETTAYRSGELATTRVRLRHRASGRLHVELAAREGAYTIPRRTLRVVAHGVGHPRALLLDGRRIPEEAGAPGWSVAEGRVEVRLDDDGRACSVEIEAAS